jgi:hypothetical protein
VQDSILGSKYQAASFVFPGDLKSKLGKRISKKGKMMRFRFFFFARIGEEGGKSREWEFQKKRVYPKKDRDVNSPQKFLLRELIPL